MVTANLCRETIASGICHADCCGLIPFSDMFYAEHHELVIEERIEQLLRVPEVNVVLPITDDMKCCFLDRQELLCRVYDDRPEICRIFGHKDELRCPYWNSEGRERTRAQRRRIKRATEAKIKAQIRKIRLS